MEGGHGGAWIAALKQELESASNTVVPDWSLYQLPLKLRSRSPSEDHYTPRAVSIGPLHHGDAIFAGMEKQKLRYMASLLKRNRAETPDTNLMNCATQILNIETQARQCYKDIFTSQGSGSGNLAKLLLIDGCFILELFIRLCKADTAQGAPYRELLTHPIFQLNTDADDPLLNITWTQFVLRLDLALLENQIPFFILEDLLRAIAGRDYEQLPNNSLAIMALNFFKPLLQNASLPPVPVSSLGESRTHLLHLLLNTYQQPEEQVPEGVKIIDYVSSFPMNKLIPSASKLRDRGIAFEMAQNRNLIDVKFSNGTFEIPPLHLTKSTELFLSNLMAFECCLKNRQQNIASYALLMSQLIQSTKDVALLEAQGIIVNGLGNGAGVCLMFQRLVTQHFPTKLTFRMLFEEVNLDLQRRQSFQEKFKRGYLYTRWGTISFMVFNLLIMFFFLVLLAASFFQPLPNNIILSLMGLAYAYSKLYKQLQTTHLKFT